MLSISRNKWEKYIVCEGRGEGGLNDDQKNICSFLNCFFEKGLSYPAAACRHVHSVYTSWVFNPTKILYVIYFYSIRYGRIGRGEGAKGAPFPNGPIRSTYKEPTRLKKCELLKNLRRKLFPDVDRANVNALFLFGLVA